MAAIFQTTVSNAYSGMNFRISIQFSPNFVPKGPIYNKPSLVYKIAWREQARKPWSESMLPYLLTHACITRPPWINIVYSYNVGRDNVVQL